MGTLVKFLLKVLGALIVAAFIFAFAFNRWIQPDANGNAEELSSTGKYIQIESETIHYLDEGSGNTVFLLLHGYGSSADTWRFLIPDLTKKGRVIAPDLVGFGYSSKGKDINYRLEARVERMNKFLQALNVQHVIIVGHGYGTEVALAYAQSYEESIDGMMLISPTVLKKSSMPGVFLRIPEISRAVLKLVYSEKRLESIYKQGYADPTLITPADVLLYQTPYKVKGTEDSLLQISYQRDTKTFNATVLVTPTAIVWGEKDHVVARADADRLAADMYDASFLSFPGVGYFAQEEAPDQVLEQIEVLLDRIKLNS